MSVKTKMELYIKVKQCCSNCKNYSLICIPGSGMVNYCCMPGVIDNELPGYCDSFNYKDPELYFGLKVPLDNKYIIKRKEEKE